MTEQTRLQGLPQVRRASTQAPQEAVAARPGNYMSALPQGGGELDGLLKGLSALNPALNGYMNSAFKREQKQQSAEGAAFAQQVQNPGEILTGQDAVGVTPPPAVSDTFRESMREVLAQRAGIENKAAFQAEYNEQKHLPDFNPEKFLQEKRASALKGIIDPTAQAAVGGHLAELEVAVMADVNRTRLAKAIEVRNQSLDTLAGDTFTADKGADAMYAAWPQFLERAKATGISAPEAANVVLQRLTYASSKAGGMPELFDLFDRKGPDGVPIGGGPLLAQVDQARKQAVAQREKAIHEATETRRADLYKGYVDDLDTNPEAVTWERLTNDIGPHALTAKEAVAYWDRRNDALASRAASGAMDEAAAGGGLWRFPESQQKKWLESAGAPIVNAWAEAKDAESIAAIGARLVSLHSQTKASVPIDVVARRVSTVVTSLPDAKGVPPDFDGIASLYKALSASPEYRDLYFDKDTARIMEAYTRGTGSGADANTAYRDAYRHTTPEAVKAAEEYRRSPEFTKVLEADHKKWVTGSSWVPRILGGNGRPENTGVVNAWAREAAVKFRMENPTASDSDMEAHMARETSRNWVMDTTSGVAVQISPTENAAAQQVAVSNFTAEMTKRLKLGEMEGDFKVVLARDGTEGAYSVYVASGNGRKLVAETTMAQLMERERAATTLSEPERAEVGRVIGIVRSGGSLESADFATIAKARGLGFLKGTDLEGVKNLEAKVFADRMKNVPQLLTDKPDMTNLRVNPARGGKVDYAVTSRVASEFTVGTMRNLSASLITMGEGVMLQTYDDPAKGAGKNIGMGYNLDANKAKAPEDLRRAGVPAERINDVLEGRASLTEEQAKKLLLVALPRYAKLAESTAESTAPGLWKRMTEAQRAVMTDVAYQVGSVEKFKKAWDSLAKGDMARFKDEIQVTYVDHTGTRKPDTRRNNLRSALLSGAPLWDSAITQSGKLPSNKLDGLALNTK